MTIVNLVPTLVCDLEGEQREAKNDAELEHVLEKRYDGGNYFSLFRGKADFPSLIIMVNEELAWLYFLTSSEHAGYVSRGAVPGLDPKGRTRFVSPGPQEEQFFNNEVVPFADALRAAKEFSVTGRLPSSVDWFELT